MLPKRASLMEDHNQRIERKWDGMDHFINYKMENGQKILSLTDRCSNEAASCVLIDNLLKIATNKEATVTEMWDQIGGCWNWTFMGSFNNWEPPFGGEGAGNDGKFMWNHLYEMVTPAGAAFFVREEM